MQEHFLMSAIVDTRLILSYNRVKVTHQLSSTFHSRHLYPEVRVELMCSLRDLRRSDPSSL